MENVGNKMVDRDTDPMSSLHRHPLGTKECSTL